MLPALFSFLPTVLLPAQTLDWAHAIGGTSTEDARDVAIDGNGNVITVGSFYGTLDLDPGPAAFPVTSPNNAQDIFVQKLDANGNFLWGGRIGGNDFDIGYGVAIDGQDNVLITGRFLGTVDLDPGMGTANVTSTGGSYDVCVVKLDANGNYVWGKAFGGSGNDEGYAIATDGNNDVITVGVLGNGGDLDPGPGQFNVTWMGGKDAFAQRLDANGNFIWAARFGASGDDIAWSVDTDPNNATFITGEFRGTVDFDPTTSTVNRTSNGDADIFLVKFDANGSLAWADTFGGTSFERGHAVTVDASGSPSFTGVINSVTDMDPGAGTFDLNGSAFEDSFLTKLDGNGNFQWAFLLHGFLNEGLSLASDAAGDIYTCGVFGGTMDIDPGPGINNLNSSQGKDGYVIKYTASGDLTWGFSIDGNVNEIIAALAIAPGAIAVCGTLNGTMDVEPGAGVTNLVSNGLSDGFLVHYLESTACSNAQVAMEVFLGGPYVAADQLMTDTLRVQGVLPLNEPYTAMGFTLTGPGATTNAVLSITGADAIVDWVVVELRDPNDPTQVVEARAALLQRDGDVVDVDGMSPIGFCAPDGTYDVAIRHRNHLGVMTGTHVALSQTPTVIDLTDMTTLTFGTDGREDIAGTQVLWPGNVVPDAEVKYAGGSNDRDPILVAIGGTVPTAVAFGYLAEDLNMDGVVKYAGASNDRDLILLTIGGSVPTNTRQEQLP
ncbi:MAG: hypothetical protein H6594_06630 [Flavobacteriales bacterium]|nr:hypothetical protein [Flavobacteriales bacterium]